ncbi:hypothetical protein [Sphingomonas sp. SORGH_AS_0879]|uniref:hypothetical protein n=1 Tax=Sphingomonas sp. SORGH_AS_0879 TaxID=3041790 RepID=UPI002783C598|nr:hypothetical protein [Sphingomonas sp. SORGH_AS_0879]MDQ1229311.1 hypothetical protein [Sphingomonas sp. SORGH_AS_0879]
MITLRDGIIGVTALAILSAVSISVAIFLGNVEAGDILSFEGALVGAAGAVWGALYVEGRKRRISALEEQQPVLDAIDTHIGSVKRLISINGLTDDNRREFLTSSQVFKDVYSFYPPKRPSIIAVRKNVERSERDFKHFVINLAFIVHQLATLPDDVISIGDQLCVDLRKLRNLHAKTS